MFSQFWRQTLSVSLFTALMLNSELVLSQILTPKQQIAQLAKLETWQAVVEQGKSLQTSFVKTPSQQVLLLKALGKEALKREQLNAALAYYQQLAAFTQEQPVSSDHFHAQKMQGITSYHLGNYLESIKYYQNALNVMRQLGDPLEQAHLYSNLGLAFLKSHDLEQAINNYVEAHRLYEMHGSDQDRADMLLNLSGAYIRQYRYEIAEDMLLRAVSLFNQLKDDYGLAIAQANLGVIYSETDKYQLARASLLAAIKYYKSVSSNRHLSFEYTNLANLSVAVGNIDNAQQEAEQALKYAELADIESGRMEALFPLANIQLHLGEFELAKTYIQESIRLAREQGAGLREKEGLAVLALVQANLGESQAAIESFAEYKKLQRKLLNDNLITRLQEYQSKMEAAELSQEITMLKQQKAMQALNMEKREQLIWFAIAVALSVFIAAISIYRKRMEQAANLQLSQQVAKRTAELQKLADELRQANQVKSQFLANISHEIRTPLTSILGHSEALLLEYKDDANIQGALQVVQRQGQHLKDLVSDVLDLSKIEAQRFELEFTEFTLQELLSDISDMFQYACEKKGLSFIVEDNLTNPFVVKLDYIRLKQILINLLGNAVKFTERGRVILSVKEKQGGVRFSVLDTGIGMDEEQLKRIFESFQQGDNSISRRFGGSGLGLSLSQQLASMMGGSIQVNSQHGRGSEFSVLIPCVAMSSQTAQEAVTKESDTAQLSGTVLVAEDHIDNRTLFTRLLEQLGVEVLSAENGSEAVEKTLIEFPDLVLMDIQMPKMNGLDALKLLRESGFDGPVYALTANVMEHEIKEYLSLGFTGHLGKPLDRVKLIQVLQCHLASNRSDLSLDLQIDMSDLVESFASSLEQERFTVMDLWQSQNWSELQSACHRIAGAASTFGFNDIAKTAKQLEEELKSPQADHTCRQHWYLILCDELLQASISE